jgi:hypothetical protein
LGEFFAALRVRVLNQTPDFAGQPLDFGFALRLRNHLRPTLVRKTSAVGGECLIIELCASNAYANVRAGWWLRPPAPTLYGGLSFAREFCKIEFDKMKCAELGDSDFLAV